MAMALPLIGIAATIAGGAATAYGQAQGGKQEKEMYDYRSAIAAQEAIRERDLGERRAGERGLQLAQQAGHIVAAQGGSGLDVTRGSAKEVQAGQYAVSQIEQGDIRYGAAAKARGQEVQAKLYTAAGKEAKWAGDVKAFGTVLGTVGSVASKWYQASSLGMGGGDKSPIDLYGSDFEKVGSI